jgi:hypothetical protein
VRTKAAVMGVRGTDFVYSTAADSAKAEVRTLQGAVEVAKTDDILLSGQGKIVQANQMVSASDGNISTPKDFDREEFTKTLQQSQPESTMLASNDAEIQQEALHANASDYVPDPIEPRDFQFGNFEVGAHMIGLGGSSASGSTITTAVGWSPVFKLFHPFWLRPSFAVFPIKSRNSYGASKTNMAGSGILFLSFQTTGSLQIEAGAGAEYWSAKGGAFGWAAQAAYRLSPNGFLERLFAGVRVSSAKSGNSTINATHFVGGVGFRLF